MNYRAWSFRVMAAVALMALLALSGETARADARIALVIGNSKYSGSLGALKNPSSDAKLVSKALASVGFKVTTLLDADQRAMKRAISDFGEAVAGAGPNSVALFFYAGHGVQVGGTNYLVPVGAQIEREGDVDLEAIEAEAVLKQLEYAGAEVSIIVLDACRNNPLPRSFRSGDRGLARMDAPTGSFVAYSTAPGDVAVDGEGANSPFAAALAEEVKQPGASVEEVFRSVRRKVMSATSERQVPWDSSSLTAPFFFNQGGQQVASAQPAPAAAQPAQPSGSGEQMLSAEILMWETVKDSQRAADFQAYLKRFPNGVYAELALTRLQELSGGTISEPAQQPAATIEEPAQVAAVAPQPAPETEPDSGGAGGETWLVDARFKSEIDKYFEKAAGKSKQIRALAIAKDGSAIGVGLYTPKVASGYFGGGDVKDDERMVSEDALKKCGGAGRCSVAYLGMRKVGQFEIAFTDGQAISQTADTSANSDAAAEAEQPQADAVETASRSAVGGQWVVAASLQEKIEDYLASAKKGGKQLRALAIAIDGSKIGVGLYTPKVASGYWGGGDVQDDERQVTENALKKCGGQSECKIAYIGDKKNGDFELAFQ